MMMMIITIRADINHALYLQPLLAKWRLRPLPPASRPGRDARPLTMKLHSIHYVSFITMSDIMCFIHDFIMD